MAETRDTGGKDTSEHPWDSKGGPAFPAEDANFYWPGMDLRDYFAAQALKDDHFSVAKCVTERRFEDAQMHAESLAEAVYLIADAMLAERAK